MNTTQSRWFGGLAAVVLLGIGGFVAGRALTESAPSTRAATEAAPAEPEPAFRPDLALSYKAGSDELRIATAQRAVRQAPGQVEPLAQLALRFLQRKRETARGSYQLYAEDAWRAARTLDEDHAEVLVVGALIHQERHQFDAAASLARRVIAQKPDNSGGHLLLGDALLELGRYDEAGKSYQRAVDLRPDLRSYNRGAHLRWLHGDFEGAVELLELALDAGSAREPESRAWCFVDLGNMYLHRGDARRALASAEQALRAVADYAPARVLQARAQHVAGDEAAALRTMTAVVQRAPHAEILLELSEWHAQSNQMTRARQRLQEAESLAQHDPVPVALYYARRGIQTERALVLAQGELDKRKTLAVYDAYALALLRAGRIDEAARAIDKATALGGLDARLYVHRGLIELAQGKRGQAAASLAHALRLNPRVDPRLRAELERGLEARS